MGQPRATLDPRPRAVELTAALIGEAEPAPPGSLRRLVERHLLARTTFSPAELATVAVTIPSGPRRDEVWAWQDRGHARQAVELWSDAVRRLPRILDQGHEPLRLAAARPPRLADLGVIVNACGYRPAYEWIGIPGVVDETGFPVQTDGASLAAPGLSFVGVPWLRTRGSPLLLGVGDDANLVAERIAAG